MLSLGLKFEFTIRLSLLKSTFIQWHCLKPFQATLNILVSNLITFNFLLLFLFLFFLFFFSFCLFITNMCHIIRVRAQHNGVPAPTNIDIVSECWTWISLTCISLKQNKILQQLHYMNKGCTIYEQKRFLFCKFFFLFCELLVSNFPLQ